MENKKDIGKAFREKLDSLQKSPRDAVWESIDAELRNKNKRRKGFPLWFRIITPLTLFIAALFFTYPLWKDTIPVDVRTQEAIDTKGHNTIDSPEKNRDSNPSAARNKTTRNNDNVTNTGRDNNVTGNEKGINRETTAGAPAETGQPSGSINNSTATGNNNRLVDNDNIPSGGDENVENAARRAKGSSKKTNPAGNVANRKAKRSKALSAPQDKAAGAVAGTKNSGNTVGEPGSTQPNGTTDTGTKSPVAGKQDKITGTGKDLVDTGPVPAKGKETALNGKDVKIDSLPAVAITAEKLDTKKIADSLNKLYGRENTEKDKAKTKPKPPEGPPYKQFSVSAFAGPAFYKLPGNGSYIDATLETNSSTSKNSWMYGAFAGFNFNRAWGIRAGIARSGIEETVHNVVLQNTYITHGPDDEHPDGWVETVPPSSFKGIIRTKGINNNIIRQQLATGTDEMGEDIANINVTSRLSFLEVPIELTCRIYDNKFGFSVIGSFSMRYLQENTVHAHNRTGSELIGLLRTIDKVDQSLGLGINLYYEFSPNFQVNLDPVARYYFKNNPYMESSVYTIRAGLQYNFDLKEKKK